MKTKIRASMFALLLVVPGVAFGQIVTPEPRGLRVKCDGVSPGYTLFAPMSSDTTYLIDLDGTCRSHLEECLLAQRLGVLARQRTHLAAAAAIGDPQCLAEGGRAAVFKSSTSTADLALGLSVQRNAPPSPRRRCASKWKHPGNRVGSQDGG